MEITTGTSGAYEWLEADYGLSEFIADCSEVIQDRYALVTAVDGGSFQPSEADLAAGWTASGGLAYSPKIASVAELPPLSFCRDCCDGRFNEWYVFDQVPESLGSVANGDIFRTGIVPGSVWAFVNFLGFRLSDARYKWIDDLYWRQLDWMRPESYLADGDACFRFATRNQALFRSVRATIAGI